MTRWLSRGAVLERILEQWEALKLFFSSEAVAVEGKENRAADISFRLEEHGTKHILLSSSSLKTSSFTDCTARWRRDTGHFCHSLWHQRS